MFFSAYFGIDADFMAWLDAVAAHARWLGLSARVERRNFSGSDLLGLAWFEHESRLPERHFYETDQGLFACTFGEVCQQDGAPAPAELWDVLASGTDANAIRLSVSPKRGELTFIVPPTTPEQLYFTVARDRWVFADDLRFFTYVSDTALDERAVYSLLQFSAIPPPLTLYENVRRVPNGYLMKVRRGSSAPECSLFFHPFDPARGVRPELSAEQRIERGLDAVLTAVPAHSVLYFSGGVDSGLMAARLARLGRLDIRLVNYAFDTNDEEHLLAVRMATQLGFQCELVHHAPEGAAEVLERAGHDYSFPFGDISTIPTNLLVHGSRQWVSDANTVVEGTGADGAYGLAAPYPRWRRTYAVPRFIRGQIGKGYHWMDLWRFDSRLERASRFVRKSTGLRLPHVVIAQNALEGIAFDAQEDVRESVAHAVSEYLDAIARGGKPEDRLSLLDLVWVCAGRMAPKSFDALRTRGIRPIYPFLEPSMVDISSSLPWETKCAGGEAKGILKRMLAREVPAEWVYRRKTGFTRTASARATFSSAPVQEFLHDVVLSPHNPLRDYCRSDVVRRLVDRAQDRGLSVGAHIFLWTLAFTSAWLHQRPVARPASAHAVPQNTPGVGGPMRGAAWP